MNKNWADRWVDALRSGKYQQTTGTLHNGKGYCCLGVLCDVVGEEFVRVGTFYLCLGSKATLPDNICKMVDLKYDLGEYDWGQHSLASDNDGGATFEEIANFIEKRWEEL